MPDQNNKRPRPARYADAERVRELAAGLKELRPLAAEAFRAYAELESDREWALAAEHGRLSIENGELVFEGWGYDASCCEHESFMAALPLDAVCDPGWWDQAERDRAARIERERREAAERAERRRRQQEEREREQLRRLLAKYGGEG